MDEPKARLLIVDDTPAGRQVLHILLLEEPYEIFVAGSGREALELLPQARPDLVLMDVLMPGMNGYEACRRLRETPGFGEIPVYLITALDDQASRLKGLDCGADDFISKPFNSAELRARIRTVLKLNRHGRLRAERERYARLFAGTMDAIFILGRDGTILSASEEAARLLERPSAARATGLELGPRLEENSAGMLHYLLRGTGPGNGHGALPARPHRTELRLLTAGSGTRTLEATHAPVEWGGVPALQLVARDVTEFRELEEQYRQAQKMETVGQLAAGIAHDFSNVLSIINSYSTYLLSTLKEEDPHRRGVVAISNAAERATQLASQVLWFSRKPQYAPRELNLNTTLENLRPMLARLLGETIEFRLTCAPDLEEVHADASQIEQALLNLVTNARDALAGGGRLLIETANELPAGTPGDGLPRYVQIRVRDNGAGMDEATRRRVFEPFFTTKGEDGTGLGLTNVRRITKGHHGFICLRSGRGEGTEVTLYLPSTPLQPAPEQPEESRKLVLIAMPDPLDRHCVQTLLLEHGYRVLLASDRESALATAAEEAAELALVVCAEGCLALEPLPRAGGGLVPVLAVGAEGESWPGLEYLPGHPGPGRLIRAVARALAASA